MPFVSLRSVAQALSTLALVVASDGAVDVASEPDHWPLPFSATCAPFDSCGNHRFLATWTDQSPAPAASPLGLAQAQLWARAYERARAAPSSQARRKRDGAECPAAPQRHA